MTSSRRRRAAGTVLVALSAVAAWAILFLPVSAQASTDATLSALTVSPENIEDFDKDTTEYAVAVENSETAATLTPTASDSGATISVGGTAVTSGSGHQVTLAEGHNVVEIVVTAADRTSTKTYTLTIVRFAEYVHKLVDDIGIIPELMVGSRTLRGITSDGETMWVVSPADTDWVYAFKMATGAPDSSGHINVHALTHADEGGAPPNYAPQGIWVGDRIMLLSNNSTTIPTLFAYRFDPASSSWSRAQGDDVTATKDARNTRPRGIWSDGRFIWVANDGLARTGEQKKIFAYNLDNERVESEDFNTLAAGNEEPKGIWSDGEIMWVADADKTIYAYDMLTKEHLPAKDFPALSAAVWGIWSDGETMWALKPSGSDGEIRSYVMPRSSNADLSSVSLDGMENPHFDPQETSLTLATDDLTAVVTVVARTRHFRAQAAITPADANATMEGHQVNLATDTEVTVTVTAQDGTTTKTYIFEIGTAPGAPSVTLTANLGLISVDWSAPSATGSDDITSYDVRHRRAGASGGWTLLEDVGTVQSGGTFSYTIQNLTGGQEYDVQVRARNRIGAGPWSASMTATPQSATPQSAPRSVMVGAVDGEPSLNVTWSAPADAANYTISGYDLRYILTSADESADANWTLVDDASTSAGSRSYKIESLRPGESYDVQVRVANSAGDGPWSATVTGTPNGPEVSITASPTTVTEGEDFSLTVERSFSTDAALVVTVNLSESGDVIVEAGEGEMTLTIPANQTASQPSSQTTQGDSDWEAHSTVTLAIVADSAYTISASAGSVAVVVQDDDFPAATAEISVDPASLAEGDSVTATVTVTTARLEEPHADGGELLVTLGGTATSASDYAAVTTAEATLNFVVADFAETDVNGTNLYRATKTVTTTVVDDEDQEDAETIVFTLGAVTSGTSPTAAAISLGTSSATATISASDQPAASTDASLSGLSLSAGALVPGFGSDIFEYTADVDYAAHQITVTPAKNHGSATVEFLYSSDAAIDDANDDVEGQQVNLNVGSKVIKIKVTAEDGATILTYSVTVTRATPEVSISSVGFDTEGDAAVFIVSRNVAVPEELTVAIFVSETGNMVPAGSGGAGQRTVRIRNGNASRSLSVTTTGNETWQAHSTVTADILRRSHYSIATGAGTARRVVADDDFPAATAVLDLPPNPVGEGDPITATVTITTTRDEMPHRAGGQILVSTTDGTATAGADYTALTEETGTVEFDDNFSRVDTGGGVMRYRASRTLNIATLDDSNQEPAETVVVSLAPVNTGSSQTAPGIIVPTGTQTATISASDQITASDDADLNGLTLSAGTLSPGFSSSVLTYTAQVDYETERITVTPAKSDGNARVSYPNTSDADAVAAGHQVNLAVGSNEIQIKVTAEDRTTTQTYSVTVTRAAASSDATLISLSLSVGTLDPAFSGSTTSYTAAAAYAVTRITVTPATSDTDATVDYPTTTDADTNAAGHQVALDVGSNQIQIEVTAQDGSTTETYSVTVTRAKPVVRIGFGPAVSIGLRALEIFEGTELVFTVHRNAAVAESLYVKVSISELGAMVPSHAEGRKTVTIDADKTSAGFRVATVGDTVWEAHSTVTATIDADDAYTIASAQGTASIEVLDDDFPSATAELSVSETNVNEGDVIDLTVTITTTRDEQPHGNSGDIEIRTQDIGTTASDYVVIVPGGGNLDFTARNLDFDAGDFNRLDIGGGTMRYQADKTATLLIVDDTEQEVREERFFVSIGQVRSGDSPTANGISVSSGRTIVTISPNDQSNDATLASLSLSPGTLTPGFYSGTLVYSATVGYEDEQITVQATLSDSDANLEYLDNNNDALLDAGNASDHQVNLDVGVNVFKIKVTAADDATTQTYTITVTRAKPEVSISADAATVTEGDGFDFTVTRNAAVDEALEVKINIAESGDMVDDGTYEGDQTVTIAAGQTSTTYTIATEDDSAWEAHSDVSATITTDDTYTIATGVGAVTKQVLDDEFPSAAAVLSVSPASVEEGGTVTATLTVTTADNQMPHRNGGDIQVNTADGTATAGNDYTAVSSQRVRVEADEFVRASVGGATRYRFEEQIPIQITDDSDSEGAEMFSVRLARRLSGSYATVTAISVDTAASTVTINENDRSGVATLSGLTLSTGALSPGFGSGTLDYSASVGYGTNQVTVRPSKSDATAELEYLDGDGNALDDADSSSRFQVDLAVGMTVFKIKLTAEDGSSTQTYTITVTRAKPEVSIEVAADEIKEWQPVVFTVSRDESAPEPLDVIVEVSESGTMVSAANEGSTTVTIAADATSQTLELPTVKDDDWEEHSTVKAEITDNDAYTIASGAATASKQVIDNDFPRATAVLRAAPNPVAEGGTLTATVWITTLEEQMPHTDGGAIVVGTAVGTASAADFTALTTATGTLEFDAGDFSREDIGGGDIRWVAGQDATVAITDDSDQEDVERFTVTMARVLSGQSKTHDAITFGVNSGSVEVRISSSDQPTVSTDASLGGLTLSAGRLTPTFASATTSYSASVPYPVSELTVTAATGHAKANIDYLDSSDAKITDADDNTDGQQLKLAVGTNVIKIKVTAEDATTTTTYTLTITRAAASTDANLSNLTLSAGTLSPGFAAPTATYAVSVRYDVTRITVTPVKSDDNATLDYLDSSDNVLADADDNAPGQQVDLAVGGNVIQIEVTAEDEATNRTYTVTVTRANANAAPSFSSSATFDAAENQTAAGTVLATDSDADDDVTGYAITGGADQAFFSIGATLGALTFDAAPNYEDAQDQGSNNTYVVEVTATSGTGTREKTATQTITVTVTDVNTEAPDQPGAPSVAAASATSLTVNWAAPGNAGPAITDYDVQYRAGTSGGWSTKSHSGTATATTLTGLSEDTSYQVQVRATNDEGTGSWSDAGSGTTDANAAPSFSSPATFDAAENGTEVAMVMASDSDSEDKIERYDITGGADQAFFLVIASSGHLEFRDAPNYEDAQDQGSNNTYVVEVTATSGAGTREKTATQTITVTVTDVSGEAPGKPAAPTVASASASATSLSVNWAAPSNAGPAITDYDVQYRAGTSGGWSDAGHTGTAVTATLTGLSENTSYQVQVRATNAEGTGAWSDAGSGRTDANAAPSFSSPATFDMPENRTLVGSVRATDSDSDDDITGLAITGGADQTLFRINGTSGVLSITPAPNYEDAQDQDTNNTYLVEVTATSGTGTREKTATQTITVRVTDVSTEAPGKPGAPAVSVASATSLSVNWSAPSNAGPAITDYDVQYRAGMSGGWSDGGHNGTATTATLTGLSENTSYEVQVRATNADGTGSWSDAGSGSTDANAAPSFSSPATFDAAENGTEVAMVMASDSDSEDKIERYDITGGADQAFFLVIASSGHLKFRDAPNYEDAKDQDSGNTYVVEVTATSGTGEREKTATQTITVRVTDVNEAPVVTGEVRPTFEENGSTAAATYTADDPERDTITWTVDDTTNFWISEQGQLYFRTPPSFEGQTAYQVTVAATDDDANTPLSDSLSVTVTVTDAEEEGVVTIEPPRGWDGTVFTAGLDDDDGGVTGETWQWARSSNRSCQTNITSATSDAYTADANDVGQYLWATVSYADAGGADKTACAALTGRIEDSGDRPTTNNDPAFAETAPERSVGQGTGAGRSVGAPVRATDEDTGEVLTYSLGGTHAALFDIDPVTGQIRTKAVLDYDPEGTNSYSVQVRVHDGYGPDYVSTDVGVDATIEVTITVTRVSTRTPTIGGPTGGGGPSGPSPSELDFEWTVKHDIEALAAANAAATGVWSDGETLWVANNPDGAGDGVYAYDLESGERVEEREFELDDANRAPRGVWSDGETVWVSDSGRDKLFAHDLASGERLPDSDLTLHPDNDDPRGLWSDGETMWVLDGRDDALFAYDLESGQLLAECALDPANGDPRGLWSDGVTIWVSDDGAKRLFAYRLPLLPEEAEDSDVEDADADGKELERVRDEEFTKLSRASNNSPRGIWSDGDVMYVADASDDKVYSYNMPDAIDARLASLVPSGVEIGEFSPGREEYDGVADEGVTETTVEAEAMQRRTTVVIEPPDADDNEANGHQVALEGVEAITVTVTSADDSRRKTYRVRFPETGWDPARDPWPHCLRGAVSEGFSLVVFAGGSVDDLAACAESREIVAFYALHEGVYVSYLLVAPDFVNEPFRELFADGLPSITPLLAASNGPPSADPFGGDLEAAGQPWPQCLRGEIAPGFSLVVFEGGSIEQLVSCAESRHVTALYIQHNGEWVSYILGAPDFANVSFVELYADGLPAVTPLVVKSDGPPAGDADRDGSASN